MLQSIMRMGYYIQSRKINLKAKDFDENENYSK